MTQDIGVAVVGLGRIGLVHDRGSRRVPDHYPDNPLSPRLKTAADAARTIAGTEGAGA